MSISVEWLTTDIPAVLIDKDQDWSDAFGSKIDAGHVGLWMDSGGGGALLEGTPAEIRKWLRDAMDLIDGRLDSLGEAVARARAAAAGDSNDEEIAALTEALDAALAGLGRDDLR